MLWVHEEDLPEAIPLLLIMIWETEEDDERKNMLPLINSMVNFDLELSRKQKAHHQYLTRFKEKICIDSKSAEPPVKEAESLLREHKAWPFNHLVPRG